MKHPSLGIIGLGYIGMLHLKHGLMLSNANLVAVADISKKALRTAKKTGVKKIFTDYKQLLKDPEIDAVVIALPTHLHLECAKRASEAKKHIFLEKPIALNVAEAKEILSAVKRNHVKLMMGYPLRFNSEFRRVKSEIERGLLGDVESTCATYISSGPFFHRTEGTAPVPVPEWWFNKNLTGGGVLVDLGSHMINLLRWYFGEITDIRSRLRHRFNLDFEDSAICLANFDSGTCAVINTGWYSQKYHLSLDFFGTVKHATAQQTPSHLLKTVTQLLTTGISKFHQPHFSELQYFVNCLIKDLPPSPSGHDGLKDLEAISKAYENQIHLT